MKCILVKSDWLDDWYTIDVPFGSQLIAEQLQQFGMGRWIVRTQIVHRRREADAEQQADEIG